MDLVQQSVKVSAKIHCQCSNPNEQKVKLLHYHVHPFTSRQVLAFYFCCKKRIPYYVIFRKIIKKFLFFFSLRSLVNWPPLPWIQPNKLLEAVIPSRKGALSLVNILDITSIHLSVPNPNTSTWSPSWKGVLLCCHFHGEKIKFNITIFSLVFFNLPLFSRIFLKSRLRMYKYNPMNMLRTVFSQYATDAEGRISVRRHEYSLMYVVFFIYIHFGQNISWNWFLFDIYYLGTILFNLPPKKWKSFWLLDMDPRLKKADPWYTIRYAVPFSRAKKFVI